MKPLMYIRSFFRRWLWIALSLLGPALGSWLAIKYWESLSEHEDSVSDTIRNVSFVIAGVTVLSLALWRGFVAEDQAEAAQQSLRNERYQRGAKMLGSNVLSVRLAGIYALQRLAKEYPKEYHVQIMRLLCAFVRYPTKDKRYEAKLKGDVGQLREDVQAVMDVITTRNKSEIKLERAERLRLDLDYAYLCHARLAGADLSGAIFWEANLSHAILWKADLSGATFWGANLFGASLDDADLSGVSLANVRDATVLTPATGLRQDQLNQARARIDTLCIPVGVLDPEGNQLNWTGGQGEPL